MHSPALMYAEFEVHRTMIRDRVRTEAFQRAIEAVVRPGDVVLDVGAGSGVLSMFAARAGAARVYAVEETSAAVLAHQLIAANGFDDIVQVIQGDLLDIEPAERVDVVVSEWLGGFGIGEGMLVPVVAAYDPPLTQARAPYEAETVLNIRETERQTRWRSGSARDCRRSPAFGRAGGGTDASPEWARTTRVLSVLIVIMARLREARTSNAVQATSSGHLVSGSRRHGVGVSPPERTSGRSLPLVVCPPSGVR